MNFGPRFVGLTGSPEQIAEAAKAYRVAYSKFQEEDPKPDDYSIDHSALVYLMGKDGEYHHPFRLWHAGRQNGRNSAPLPLAARPIGPRDTMSLHCNIESPCDSAMQHLRVTSADGRVNSCCTISTS